MELLVLCLGPNIQCLQEIFPSPLHFPVCFFAHFSHQWSIGWVALSFLVHCCSSFRYGDTRPNLHFFLIIYRHKSPILTQNHLIPSSTEYWPSTTNYQPVPILTQYHQLLTSTAFFWPSTIIYQPVLHSTDPVPPSTNQLRLLLTQNYHIWTSTAPHWPNTTKYQTVPPSTDPVYQISYSIIRLSFVNLRWAQLYIWVSFCRAGKMAV